MKRTALDYTLKVKLPITVFVIVVTFALTYYIARPERDGMGYGPEQEIKFSHKLHAGDMNIDCKYCHTGVEKGRHATIPALSTCMNCHSFARKDRPDIVKLTNYYENNLPVPWKRVHRVPDYAYFNHSSHVLKGIDCKYCHGDVRKMEVVQQLHSFTMGACLNCHRNPKAEMKDLTAEVKNGPTTCYGCHR
ncbi:MAG: cytochrome c3 family protein [Candidatus Kapabacteria bacterium]|nr:cytochrome c3 family protein [Candidatus Kapabacteria bacterium]